jgi:hypothetical protein
MRCLELKTPYSRSDGLPIPFAMAEAMDAEVAKKPPKTN